MHIGLVGCGKKKLNYTAPARELYQGELFKKAAAYCDRNYDGWYILSAKHGLVHPDTVLEPYDATLNDMNQSEVDLWAQEVASSLNGGTYYIHAGKQYQHLKNYLADYNIPVPTVGIGKKLQWYKEQEKPQFYCVLSNRDFLKVKKDGHETKVPIWRFIDGQENWLTSLVYIKPGAWQTDPVPGHRFLDCGAWSYKNDEVPKWSVDECIEMYNQYANMGDIITSPDHLVMRNHDATIENERIALSLSNAHKFIKKYPKQFVPIAVTHGNDIDKRIAMTKQLLDMGYRYIAIGGVAGRAGNRKFVQEVIERTCNLREHGYFKIHVLGISALSWLPVYEEYGVNSYDGSSMFFSAFTGASYYWLDPNHISGITKYSVKDLNAEDIPICHCPACVTMRKQGDDTRTMGSNERNMGRAVHNINVYLQAKKSGIKPKPRQVSLFDEGVSYGINNSQT